MNSYLELPDNLPEPEDDGATRHLKGRPAPDMDLASTDGGKVNLAALTGRTVVYAYPMTGRPGVALPEGWDMIPGARGCTPESCAFRDHHAQLETLGARVFGLSTQSTDYQIEMARRLHLPFAILSDEDMKLTRCLDLPTFAAAGVTLLKRLTLVLKDAEIEHVFYPVFPPDTHAGDVIAWLEAKC